MLSVDVMDDAYFVCVGLCLSKEYRVYCCVGLVWMSSGSGRWEYSRPTWCVVVCRFYIIWIYLHNMDVTLSVCRRKRMKV